MAGAFLGWSFRLALAVAVLVPVLTAAPAPVAADDPQLANNDFGNNGERSVPDGAYLPGAKERGSDEYKAENKVPSERDYYRRGGEATNHDGRCRARVAYKAARYQGPTNGYEAQLSASPVPDNANHKDGPRPKAGGGIYANEMPTDPAAIIRNIYKFVEDVTYPKGQPAQFKSDSAICGLIEGGAIDIGKARAGDRFMCYETIHFFTSLVRELGFPAREKNVLPSVKPGTYDTQTAAANVWYREVDAEGKPKDGKWHFFDPWESFTDSERYLKGGPGHAGYGGAYHDADIWVRVKPPHPVKRFGSDTLSSYSFDNGQPRGLQSERPSWKLIKSHKRNGAKIETETLSLRLGVRDALGRVTGGSSGTPVTDIPDSLYVPHDKRVQVDHGEEPLDETYDLELVTLLYGDQESKGVLYYELVVHNPSTAAQPFKVALGGLPATVAIQVSPLQITGSIEPYETLTFPFEVAIGQPLKLPPQPVTDLYVGSQDGTAVRLQWSPVTGASTYRVYSSPQLFEDPGEAGVQFLGETTSTAFDMAATEFLVVGVEAVASNELSSGLEAEGGSTTVVAPPPPPSLGGVADYSSLSSGSNARLAAVAAALAAAVVVAGTAWYVRRRGLR